MNSLINYLDKYHSQLTVLLLGLSLIVLAVFLWVWFYNRKKYHHLKHQIPASVVKNYLDSIIQNSTALKSSLFRGGGLDVNAEGVPSVMPLSDLPSGAGINISSGAEDSALRAELAKLQAALNEKNSAIRDLENKNTEYSGDVKSLQEKLAQLEKLMAGKGSEGGDPEAAQKVEQLSKEKEKLQEDLKQFEIISDDLADLKRLKQENAQLKKALEESGGQLPETEPEAEETSEPSAEDLDEAEAPEEAQVEEEAAPEEEAVGESPSEDEEPETEEEEPAAEAEEEPVEAKKAADDGEEAETEEPAAQEAAAAESSDADEEDSEAKSPEDLLSEFEKMLG